MKKLLFLTIVSMANIAMSLQAAEPYLYSPVGWSGTGCSKNTVRLDGVRSTEITVLFDSYDVGKNSTSGRKSQSTCSFTVPINIPKGMYLGRQLDLSLKGFSRGKGTSINIRYKLSGAGLPNAIRGKRRINFEDRRGNRYWSVSDLVPVKRIGSDGVPVNYIGCDGSNKAYLRIDTSIKSSDQKSYIAIDTQDLTGYIKVRGRFGDCRYLDLKVE